MLKPVEKEKLKNPEKGANQKNKENPENPENPEKGANNLKKK